MPVAMRISMPLAGMDEGAQAARDRKNRLTSEARAFRMLSEGELFYVDTDLDEDALSTNRHDHGHLGGISLADISASMAKRKPGQAQLKPESIAETEIASRSTSQDSSSSGEDLWKYRHDGGGGDSRAAPPLLKKAHEWDYSQLDDAFLVGRTREKSFSEPQLRHCRQPLPQQRRYDDQPVAPPPPSMPIRRRSMLDEHDGRRVDGNAGNGLQRGLVCLFGGRRVESVSRNLSSCTSTKTFEFSCSERERDAFASLGVIPDTGSGGIDGGGSMTFTMHIAGYRVVSCMFGRHAEFEVRVKGGGRSWSRWHRFSKFKLVAACVETDTDAMRAWRRVVGSMPHFRCLHPEYLGQKCHLLETFLKQVLFALPTPALLIHFVSEK